MSSTRFEVGCVIRKFTEHTDPPKRKRHVIVCINPKCIALLINSELTPFAKKRPDVLADHLPISPVRNNFIEKNSFIDCGEVFIESSAICCQWLDNGNADYLGECSIETTANIVSRVLASKQLSDRFRVPVVNAMSARIASLMIQ